MRDFSKPHVLTAAFSLAHRMAKIKCNIALRSVDGLLVSKSRFSVHATAPVTNIDSVLVTLAPHLPKLKERFHVHPLAPLGLEKPKEGPDQDADGLWNVDMTAVRTTPKLSENIVSHLFHSSTSHTKHFVHLCLAVMQR